ncbi:MAG: NusG domain II-containing protein [Bacilli bacterium]|nr:NusG domain II-containing protein [Bacillales bacterium]MDY2575703.1 NusG domain II-containing protein [Bacilli bacterium]
MNKNFSLKHSIKDIILVSISLVIAIVFIVVILLSNKAFSSNNRYLNVYHQNTRLNININLNDLTENQIIILKKEDYPRLINDFKIEVSNKKGVRVKEVTCYDNTCINQGWINVVNLPIVCIPNDVKIVLTSTSGITGDDVIGGIKYEKILY